jgi:hypothetical protein
MSKLLYFFILVSLLACQRTVAPQVAIQKNAIVKIEKPREISFQLRSIKATDIQENISFQDELWIEYNLVAIQSGKIIRVETASRFLGGIKQGAKIDLDSIPPLKISLNPGEQVGIQVSLWELDDYTKDQHLLHQVNRWGGMLQVPLMILDWSALTNPVSWFMWGTRIGSVGLDYWAKQDGRDLLGVSELQWDWSVLPKGKVTRYKRGNWKGGKRGLNTFQYSYSYEIHVNE